MTALLLALIAAYGLDNHQRCKKIQEYQDRKHWSMGYTYSDEYKKLWEDCVKKIDGELLENKNNYENPFDLLISLYDKYKIPKGASYGTTPPLFSRVFSTEEYKKFSQSYDKAIEHVATGRRAFVKSLKFGSGGEIEIILVEKDDVRVASLSQQVYDYEHATQQSAGGFNRIMDKMVFEIKNQKNKMYHSILLCKSLLDIYAYLINSLIHRLIDDQDYLLKIELRPNGEYSKSQLASQYQLNNDLIKRRKQNKQSISSLIFQNICIIITYILIVLLCVDFAIFVALIQATDTKILFNIFCWISFSIIALWIILLVTKKPK